ncbi:MAG: glycosyltransferase family 2 protein [Planctomycetota bacterium]|nr:glycosyltransferase family 2 protein [Planctomycetota bacterium]
MEHDERIDPRRRWGALVLVDALVPELEDQLARLVTCTSRVLVLAGTRAEGWPVSVNERLSHPVQADEALVAALAELIATIPDPAGRLELVAQTGDQTDVMNDALLRLGTEECLVLGAGEWIEDLVGFQQSAEADRAWDLPTTWAWGAAAADGAPTLFAVRPSKFYFEGPRSACMPISFLVDERLVPCPPITFAEDDAPEVSVIVPFYGEVEVTLACARSVLANTSPDGPSFELILRDDRGPAAIPEDEPLLGDDRVRLSRGEENLGFLRTVNAAAREARGRHLLLLNNDTEVLPGWMEALVAVLEEDRGVGVVASTLLYPDGSLQEAGGIVFADASGSNYGKHDDPSQPTYRYRRRVDYGSGASLLVRRAVWDELGGFDERYAPAYYEDTDLCFRARAAGHAVVFEPRSRVVHLEGHTSGTDLAQGAKRHQVTNRARFLERWQAELAAQHHPPGTRADVAREHGARGEVVVVLPDFEEPEEGLLASLRGLGLHVTVIGFARERQRARRALEARGVQTVLAREDNPSFNQLPPRRPVDLLWFAAPADPKLIRRAPGAKVVAAGVGAATWRVTTCADLVLPASADPAETLRANPHLLQAAKGLARCGRWLRTFRA